MKKISIVCVGIFLILIVIIFVLFNIFYVKKFDVTEYDAEINQFPCDIVVGKVNTKTQAKKKAEELWIELYGAEIKEEKPYKVYYDEEKEVWMVTGCMSFLAKGGVAYAIISKQDGRVLAVWHEK